jgi:hypothetical protein
MKSNDATNKKSREIRIKVYTFLWLIIYKANCEN